MSERVRSHACTRIAKLLSGHTKLERNLAGDLLDARTKAEDQAAEHRKEYCQVVSENIGHRQRIAELERERDEARPIVEAAMRQYEAAAPCGWIGAWWLNPAFQTAAIQLHVTCEAAARAAAKENS
jgi:hypothetical protein